MEETETKLELVKQAVFNERRFPMHEFMKDLVKSTSPDPSKVSVVNVEAQVETKVESTTFIHGEKVKIEEPIKTDKVSVETKFLREKTMYVTFEGGSTVNLGNYNNGKIRVSLSMPVGMEITPELLQKIDSTYEFMKAWCEKKLDQEVKELLALRQ